MNEVERDGDAAEVCRRERVMVSGYRWVGENRRIESNRTTGRGQRAIGLV